MLPSVHPDEVLLWQNYSRASIPKLYRAPTAYRKSKEDRHPAMLQSRYTQLPTACVASDSSTILENLPLVHGFHGAYVGHVKLQGCDADVTIGNDR